MNSLNPTIAEDETTGRYLVLFREDAVAAGVQMLSESVGIGVASGDQSQESNTVILNTLGVVVVSAEPEQLRLLSVAEDNSILAIEPCRQPRW